MGQADPGSSPEQATRKTPTGVMILAVLFLLGDAAGIHAGMLLTPRPDLPPDWISPEGLLVATLFWVAQLPLGVFSIIVAVGFLRARGWAWTGGILVSIADIAGILGVRVYGLLPFPKNVDTPVGWVIIIWLVALSVIVILYLTRPHVRAYFGRIEKGRLESIGEPSAWRVPGKWVNVLLLLLLASAAAGSFYIGTLTTLPTDGRTTQTDRTVTRVVTEMVNGSETTTVMVLTPDTSSPAGPVSQNLTLVGVVEGDFMLMAWVDKTEYREDEPVTVWFNLTHIGESAVPVDIGNGAFRVLVEGDDGTSIYGPRRFLAGTFSLTFTPGMSIEGRVVLRDGESIASYLRGEYGAGEPTVHLLPGHTYQITGSVLFVAWDLVEISAPPLTITVLE